MIVYYLKLVITLGVFCCLSILLDQIRNDGLVDVFQTVRHLREQRPHLIQTQEQYNFCYWSLLEHLNETQEVGFCSKEIGNCVETLSKVHVTFSMLLAEAVQFLLFLSLHLR